MTEKERLISELAGLLSDRSADDIRRIIQLVKEYHPVTLYFDPKRIVAVSKGSISLFTASSKPTAENYRQQLLKYARFCEELVRLIPD